ncbi:MAG: TonB family protein [bacterium]
MKRVLLLILAASLLSGCLYYNTFYNARKFFNEAEASRKKENRDKASGGERQNYERAIKKCSKVLAESPGSKYEDDALFIIGKSFYYMGDEYQKAERKFRELLSTYPESPYAEESRFFLGKSRFQLENYQLATETFERVVKEGKRQDWRAEALLLLAEIHNAQERPERAIEQYTRFVEEFGSHPRLSEAYFNLGELFANKEQFDTATVLFGKAAESAKKPEDIYAALHQQGVAYYEIDSIAAGMAIFEQLGGNEDYLNHEGEIRLRLAEGRYLQGDWEQAIRDFDEITTDFKGKIEEVEAYYMMGVIIQDDLDDLETAKEMFDWASRGRGQSEFKGLALERSANIAKVTEYRENLSSDQLENAISNRFLLAELYRETLNRPDSALREYQSLVEAYPGSEQAPRALLAMGWLYENAYGDSASARDAYREVLRDYPYTDEYGYAVKLLGLEGTAYDSLTSRKMFHEAETQFLDKQDLDSARTLFTDFKYRFPDSELLPKAEFALAHIDQRTYFPKPAPPGDSTFVDSTIIKTFARLGDRYAGTPIGEEAKRLAAGEPREKPRAHQQRQQQRQQQQQQQEQQAGEDSTLAQFEDLPPGADTLSPAQLEELRLQDIIEELPLLDKDPTVLVEFNYPISAYGDRFEGRVMTKIKVEFDGKVTEVELLKPSGIEDIDREIERVLLLTEFNPMEIDPLNIGGYLLYYYQVRLPDFLEGTRDQ